MHGLHLLKAIVKGRLAFQAVILDDLAQSPLLLAAARVGKGRSYPTATTNRTIDT
jgi:hypothetical protein